MVWLWKASIALEILLCGRLALTGLWRNFPWFFAYVAALAAESGLLVLATQSLGLYPKIWVSTRVVLLILELLAVLEIFRRWADSYPGFENYGRGLLLILLALSTGLCLASIPVNWSAKGWVLAVYVMSVANRAVQTGLAAFLLLMLGFFLKFGGPVAPNLRRHTWAMTVFLAANTFGYFLITSKVYQVGNTALQIISAGALVYWTFALTQAGAKAPITAPDPETWEEAEELNRHILDVADSVRQSRRAVGKK